MSVQQTGTVDVARAAYESAWQEFINLTALSADERTVGRTDCAGTYTS